MSEFNLDNFSAGQRDRLRDDALRTAAPTKLGAYGWIVYGWKPAAHHEEWIDVLEDQSLRRVNFICPPGHAKTNWAGICYAGWRVGQDPNIRMGYLSSTSGIAHRPSTAIRDTIAKSEAYQTIFPGIEPDYDRGWAEGEWYVKRGKLGLKDATLQAAGLLGAIIGSRWDELIMDDVCDQLNTATAGMREKTRDWVLRTAFSRLVGAEAGGGTGGRIINVMTRWHAEDLALLIDQLGDFTTIHMPALGYYEKKRGMVWFPGEKEKMEQDRVKVERKVGGHGGALERCEKDELGGKRDGITHNEVVRALTRGEKKDKTPGICIGEGDSGAREHNDSAVRQLSDSKGQPLHVHIREEEETEQAQGQAPEQAGKMELIEGEALWPSEHTKEALMKIRNVNPHAFQGMYQGYPTSPMGNIFKRSWWKYYLECPKPGDYLFAIQMWDTAFKAKQDSDYSVCYTILVAESGKLYVVDEVRGRMEFPELQQSLKAQYLKWRPWVVLVEGQASGQSLVQAIKKDAGMIPVLEVPVTKDAITRAHSCTGLIKSGQILLPAHESWVYDMLDEFAEYDKAAHDDRVSSLTLGVNWLIGEELLRIEEALLESGEELVRGHEQAGVKGVGLTLESALGMMPGEEDEAMAAMGWISLG